MPIRAIQTIIQPKTVIEGAGVKLRRSIFPHHSNVFDPFILFDHFIFENPIEGPISGFPMHPHRGIETVTYMLSGSTHHRDSLGNTGVIGPGDVQWMTSGSGILHEEMPRKDKHGHVDGFQLWVNLPSSQKMTKPKYQEIISTQIPQIDSNGWHAKLIAGEINGAIGPVKDIYANPSYIDLTLDTSSKFLHKIPKEDTVFLYLFEGRCAIPNHKEIIQSTTLVHLGDGDILEIYTDTGARLILISASPFNEPIVPYGPFVMNTKEEIKQALQDLRQGTFIK